jgi:hypothetical protein
MEIVRRFKNKNLLFEEIKKDFTDSKIILIRGSTAFGKVKRFSDFDVEVYQNRKRKPHYEVIFVENKLTLLTIYFYKYNKGKEKRPPKEIKIIKGDNFFNNNIIPNFEKDKYTNNEKVIRESQLLLDFLFKYLRSNDEKYLTSVQKRIKNER